MNPLMKRPHLILATLAISLVFVCLLFRSAPSTTTKLRSQLGSFFQPSSLAVVCPSPTGPPPVYKQRSGQQCTPIPSTHDNFTLELCSLPNVCDFTTLRVRREDVASCNEAESRSASLNSTLNDWMKKERGPDAFMVRVDGAQRFISESAQYEGNCSYRFDIPLRNAGDVYLDAWWTFQNYEAFSEVNRSWPQMEFSPLLHNPISISLCPGECKPHQPSLLIPNKTLIQYPPAINTALHACSGPEPVRGSFLPSHSLDVLYPPVPPPTGKGHPVAGRYQFVPESCIWTHAGRRFMDPTSCTQQRRKILFVGDSHGRVAFDGVIHRLEGNENILTRSAKAGTKMAKVGNLESTFAWDPRGATIHPRNCSILEGVDVLVTSVGAHWATNESTKKYLDVMQGILQTVENCPSTPSKLIFLTAPAQPPRQDHYVRENNDHRTNVRLQYWAEHTTDLALAAGWNVVDQFAYSQHMAIEPMYLDFAHYLSTDALDPIVDEIIGKSGLCPDV